MAKKNNFFIQAMILMAAGIITRIIGILYRIPMTNWLGDTGIYYYNQAYQVYMLFLILTSYSMPLAVSKMVSAKISQKEYINSYRILKTAIFFGLVTGGVSFCILMFGANLIAGIIKVRGCILALRVLAPALLVMPVLGSLRGYFQGMNTMMPTALSQIVEQIINAIISLLAVLFGLRGAGLLNKTFHANLSDTAYGAAGGVLGSLLGAASALILLGFIFSLYKKPLKKLMRQERRYKRTRTEDYSHILRLLVLTVVPVILSTAVYNISGFIDTSVYNNIMVHKNVGEYEALGGVFTSKYTTLIQLPTAIASSLSSSMIPSISAAVAVNNRKTALHKIDLSMRFILIISIPCAIGLAVLARPIFYLLFGWESLDIACNMMYIGCVSVVVYSLSTITNGILQGTNYMRLPVIHSAVSVVVQLLVMILLLFTTNLKAYALVIADVLFCLVVCILNVNAIHRHLRYYTSIWKTWILPLLAAGVMGVVTYFIYHIVFALIYHGSGLKLCVLAGLLLSICVAVVVYGGLLLYLQVVDENDLAAMPKGDFIIRIARKFHFM